MISAAEFCPTCGSPLDGEEECDVCAAGHGVRQRPVTFRHHACRHCHAPVPLRATVCPVCSVDHPLSVAGLPPVAQFVALLTAVALLLAVAGLLFGPLV